MAPLTKRGTMKEPMVKESPSAKYDIEDGGIPSKILPHTFLCAYKEIVSCAETVPQLCLIGAGDSGQVYLTRGFAPHSS